MSAASHFFGGGNGGVEGIPLRVLVVAGGGGSGANSVHIPSTSANNNTGAISGCGGGGAIHEIKGYPGKRGRTYNVTVGAGGTAGEALGEYTSNTQGVGIGSTAYAGGNGGNSVFTDPVGYTFTAEGGGGGGASAYHEGPTVPANYPTAYQNDSTIVYGKDGGCGGSGSIGETPGLAGGSAVYNRGGAGSAFSVLHFVAGPGAPGEVIGEDNLIQTEYGVNGGFPSSSSDSDQNISGGAGRRDINRYQWTQLAPNSNYGPGSGGGHVTDEFAGASYPQVHAGNGYLSNIEGSMKSYGAGRESVTKLQNPNVPVPGRAPDYSTALPIANTGHGAYGVYSRPYINDVYGNKFRWEGPGFAGSSGVVIVQYPSSFGNATTTGTVIDLSSNTPGYKTYKFTADGTIQLP